MEDVEIPEIKFVKFDEGTLLRWNEEFPHTQLHIYDAIKRFLDEMISGKGKMSQRERARIVISLGRTLAKFMPMVVSARQELAQRSASKTEPTDTETDDRSGSD
jgi:hypothetical protein